MNIQPSKKKAPPLWSEPDGTPLSCSEKIKVLNENWIELQQMLQDAFEDGLLLGCREMQLRQAFQELIDGLQNPYERD